MEIEYEATFTDIDKDEMRAKLKEVGAELKRPEFMQKRSVFNLPEGHEVTGGWLRVRDEGDKITMSLKVVDGDNIDNQKEICSVVDDFDTASLLLENIGCERKAYQETLRELWTLDGVEITIDTWPFLEPFIEVEGESEEVVKQVSEKIGMNWSGAKFCSVDTLFSEKYNIPNERFNDQSPKVVFDMENPFLK